MNESTNEETFSIKEFMLHAVLWLPMFFFLWFYLAPVVVWLPRMMFDLLLTTWMPDVFNGVSGFGRFGFNVEMFFDVPPDIENPTGGTAVIDVPINPMIYAYGLPLVLGLSVATPNSTLTRTIQGLIGYFVISLVQVWGCFWELFKTIAFNLGTQGQAVLETAGIAPTMVALFYQFGYLMLPAIVPIVTWILMNRSFIETIVQTSRETTPQTGGQS